MKVLTIILNTILKLACLFLVYLFVTNGHPVFAFFVLMGVVGINVTINDNDEDDYIY